MQCACKFTPKSGVSTCDPSCSQLSLSAGRAIQPKPSKGFVDICAMIPKELQRPPRLSEPAKFMPRLIPAQSQPGAHSYTDAVLTEFSADFTAKLINQCAPTLDYTLSRHC